MHQNLLTLPVTVLRSLIVSFYYVTLAPRLLGDFFKVDVDVLLLNGPGTCFVLCVAAYINRVGDLLFSLHEYERFGLQFLGLPSPKLVYVETFARVRTLSLTGKLLRPIADRCELLLYNAQILKLIYDARFIVQWPDLLQDGGRGECHGWLV